MEVTHGFRDPLTATADDTSIFTNRHVDGKTLHPSTRVVPDCGHTYFIPSHVEPSSNLIRRLCRTCEPNEILP